MRVIKQRVARAIRAHVAGLREGRHVGVRAGEFPLCIWNCCAVDMSRSDGSTEHGRTYLVFCELITRWNVTRFCFVQAARRIRRTFCLHLNLGLDSSIVHWPNDVISRTVSVVTLRLTAVGYSLLTKEILCQLITQNPLRLISRMSVAVITKARYRRTDT